MDEKCNGWTNWDTWHYKLLLDNDEPACRRQQAWATNFARKAKRGVFDLERAAYAVRKYLTPEVRRLEREYGDDPEMRIDLEKVNFTEIAESIRDTGIETLDYERRAS